VVAQPIDVHAEAAAQGPPEDAVPGITARLRAAGCVFAEDEAKLIIGSASTPDELAAMIDRRVAGLPLEHVLGWAEFCGLRIIVGPGVFVPRRRSEFLVSQAVAAVRSGSRSFRVPVVLDICCGSGALGLAVATQLGMAELHAADIDPGACEYARRNLAAIAGDVHEGDLFDSLPADLHGRVDLIVANAPYVPTAEVGVMPAEARLHEPLVALDGGSDGVNVHRRVAAIAPEWLARSGSLLIETSERQAALTEAAMARAGLTTTVVTDGDLDTTVVIGRR